MDTNSEATFTAALSAFTKANQVQDYETADRAAEDAMDLVVDLMVAEANEDGPSDDLLLAIEAKECEDTGDWEGALSAYAVALTHAEQSDLPWSIWKAHEDLVGLYLLLDRKDDALRHQRLATAAARRDDSIVVLRMALTSEASCMLRCDRTSRAKRCIDEGIALESHDSVTDELGNAWLRILDAQYYADLGKIDDARRSLQPIWPYLDRAKVMTIAAGVQSATCAWWTVEAHCCELENNSVGEVASLLHAVELARHVDGLKHAASVYTKARLSRVLELLASAFWRSGNLAEARSARIEAKDLLNRLKLPRFSS